MFIFFFVESEQINQTNRPEHVLTVDRVSKATGKLKQSLEVLDVADDRACHDDFHM